MRWVKYKGMAAVNLEQVAAFELENIAPEIVEIVFTLASGERVYWPFSDNDEAERVEKDLLLYSQTEEL